MSCKDEKLISIIIPVYNVAKYLPRCIESILNQSYKEFEAIFINDGSLDNSLEILQEYSKKDNRVHIINKENEGSGEARNIGLKKSKGQYISFIDSDDWIHKDYLKLMYEEIECSNSDVVMCNPIKTYDDENKNKNLRTGKFNIVNLEKNPEKIVDILAMPVLWNKLYKSEIIKKYKISFPKYLYHQDVEFLYKLFLRIKKIKKIEKELYYYYQRKNSVTGVINRKNIYDTYTILENIEKSIEMTQKYQINNFKKFKIQHIYGTRQEYLNKIDKNQQKEIKVLLDNSLKNIKIKEIYNSKKTLLFLLALRFNQEKTLNTIIKLFKR